MGRETKENFGTTLIETYSYEMQEGVLYENLRYKLESHGIILKLKKTEEIWKIINDAAKMN